MIETLDPYDVGIALRATGLLRTLNRPDLLSAADVHVATRLGELGAEDDERVLLAAALAVRGVRHGSVCVDLGDVRRLAPDIAWPDHDDWVAAVRASPLVGPGLPLRWDGGLLYLERYWRQEDQVCRDLLAREEQPAPVVDVDRLRAALDRLFAGDVDDQRLAAVVAATRWTTVLGGGPGTGKTTTVARLLAVLLDQPGPVPRVALAAPTAKAAARLQEAVQDLVATFDPADQARLGTLTASTIHRLLGSFPGRGTRFRHDRDNRLPFDVVVVDETSMVSLTLMARLVEAVRPDARLVLVGDPDQLASVEAGAVLADLVGGLTSRAVVRDSAVASVEALVPGASASDAWRHGVVVLGRIWRFGGAIASLAAAVRAADPDAAAAVLTAGTDDVSFTSDGVREDVVGAASAVRVAAEAGDAATALQRLSAHRLLCAHRSGPFGVDAWSREIEHWLAEERGVPEGEWYVGRPLLVTANDYANGLLNGDTGVVVREPDGGVRVAFPRAATSVTFAPSRLADVQTLHAMTVHRSQGSQFARVTLVLPEEASPLLTRELLYTALTRAQEHVRVVGTEAAFRAAVARPAARASGLRERLGNE